MGEVSKTLIIAPAKAVNPKVRVIIKFPNWYESFQGLGYDLAVEPKLFDAIYTGTETRDASVGQRLQSYQSYLQTEYFNNIKPGANQGGWIDGRGDTRYAEMFWDTFFARVPEIVLFNSVQVTGALGAGRVSVESNPDTNSILADLMAPIPQPADRSSLRTWWPAPRAIPRKSLIVFLAGLANQSVFPLTSLATLLEKPICRITSA